MEKKATGEDRLDRIERQIQELAKEVSTISAIVMDRHTRDEESKLFMSTKNVNPWTLQTAQKLSSELNSEIAPLRRTLMAPNMQYTARLFETYRDTLDVLKLDEMGCTAEEVSKKTGRSRNTESGYLYRLYLAGLLKRVRKGRKIKYVLEDKELINRVFGTV